MNLRFLPGLLALLHASGTVAQAHSPLNPQAPVPALSYTSSLASYRALSELNVGSWRDANDRVGRIGGWRVYQREAISAATPPVAPVR
jgi:hypothetical protein